MKTLTKAVAVLMLAVMLCAAMAACKANITDDRLIGSWKQTDEVNGNWIWTFEKDGKCRLMGESTGFDSAGTYHIESEGAGKIYINLEGWSEEKLFTYTVTEKVLDLEETYTSYYCFKQ